MAEQPYVPKELRVESVIQFAQRLVEEQFRTSWSLRFLLAQRSTTHHVLLHIVLKWCTCVTPEVITLWCANTDMHTLRNTDGAHIQYIQTPSQSRTQTHRQINTHGSPRLAGVSRSSWLGEGGEEEEMKAMVYSTPAIWTHQRDSERPLKRLLLWV